MNKRLIAAIIVCALVSIACGFLAFQLNDPSPATCADGWRSPSIGRPGACSWHGGVKHEFNLSGLFAVVSLFAGAASLGLILDAQKYGTPKQNEDSKLATKENESKKPDVVCPVCRAPMRLRIARKGPYKGNRFWGCSRYPNCRGIVSYHD